MSKCMIAHGALMTVDNNDTMIPDGAVIIDGDRIEKVGAYQELSSQYPNCEVIDAAGMVVMPGFVNTHTHLSMTMTRGIADDIDAFKWLPVIWAVEKNLSDGSERQSRHFPESRPRIVVSRQSKIISDTNWD